MLAKALNLKKAVHLKQVKADKNGWYKWLKQTDVTVWIKSSIF